MSSSPLFFSFSLFLLSVLRGAASINLNQTCKTIAEGDPNVGFDFCVTSLQVVPNVSTADLCELGLIAMNLTKANATNTLCQIQRLLKKKTKPYVKNCLKDCMELYSDCLSSLDEAMNATKIQKYDDANINLSAAMDAPTTCEDGFKEKKGTKSPLRKRDADMFELGAISLSIVAMLAKNQY